MAENDRIEEQTEESVPAWARNLTLAVEKLTDSLQEAMKEPEQLETEPVQKVPVPPVQEPEPEQEPERPEILEVPEQQEKPKKRKFLDWLL